MGERANGFSVLCTDKDIFSVEAYGRDHPPFFRTEEEAEKFMNECISNWPEDAPVRELYLVVETPKSAGLSDR